MDKKSIAMLRQLTRELTGPKRYPGWREKECRFCKLKFHYHRSWSPAPLMCKGCRTERKIPYKPGEGDTLYLETQVFNGGAPGSGRRK